jgi:hypothetical protein
MNNEDDKDVIKNPRRKVVQNVEKYVPEYVKKGINPIPSTGTNNEQSWTQQNEEVLPDFVDNATITVDEIPSPSGEVNNEMDIDVNTIPFGHYIVLYKEVPVIVGDVKKIKEYIVSRPEVPEEEFIVLKKCEVQFGVFIKG